MALPAKTLPELSPPCPPMSTPVVTDGGLSSHAVNPELRCESCGRAIESLRDVIIEDEYGFEGEAWGTYLRQEPHEVAITTCCRASILDTVGEPLSAYEIRDCL